MTIALDEVILVAQNWRCAVSGPLFWTGGQQYGPPSLASTTSIRMATILPREAIGALKHKVSADRARTALSAFNGWAIENGTELAVDLQNNPAANIAARAKSGSRERKLTESELIEVWRACLDDDYGRIVKLLILTGQRRCEIGDLAWSEINPEYRYLERDANDREREHVIAVIELPETRTKNKRPHLGAALR